ncbi:MAG: hypothetical protein Q8941_24560 [Bacteroidota bacterium]|nr:hypothetical protein [Bacteroidota bacterium]
MININEIRLGNWVKGFEGWGEYVEVSYVIMDQFLQGNTSRFNPIPLTPEILEKAGFERQRSKDLEDVWVKKGVGISADGYYNHDIKREYLHQLQNLYFALTGEELIINL